jgi:hypothetical protein
MAFFCSTSVDPSFFAEALKRRSTPEDRLVSDRSRMAEWSIARDSPAKSAGRKEMLGRAATAAWLILRLIGRASSSNSGKSVPSSQPLAGPRPFAPKGAAPPFASAPSRLQERPPRPSPLADLVKTLGGQILTLNGLVNQYSQVKWIFSTKMAQRKALILCKLNSHAKRV